MHHPQLLSPAFKYRNIIIGYVVWCICWIILQTLGLQYTLAFPLKPVLIDSIVTNVLIYFAGYETFIILRFYQPKPIVRLLWSAGLTGILIVVIRWLLLYFMSDDAAYIAFVEQSLFIRALFTWLMISLLTTISWMWFYMREQQESSERQKDTEKLAREAELTTLRQQLQPHFLFNSLNSISALAGTRPEEARRMIQQLSDFLRGTIKRDDQQLVTLAEELNHLHLYLEIEKVRFGHRLKTEVNHNEGAAQMKLPSLLLQPIVENAIKFGLYDTTGEITININAEALDNYLVLTVKNPFDPSTARPKQGTGFGLSSVQRRLYLLYARHDLLATRQEDSIFTTEVKVPQ